MHLAESLPREADEVIAEMKHAARRAREVHARAELLRHMLSTAKKVSDRLRGEAVALVVGEWQAAWSLGAAPSPSLGEAMRAFTEATYDYANAPSDAADDALRTTYEALDAAFGEIGSSVADEMAWRSECAHGWWAMVAPEPADAPRRGDEASAATEGFARPFWRNGCPDFCRS